MYHQSIVEDIFTKKPFTRLLTQALLEKTFDSPDGAKVARECLKNLTSEDLWQLKVLSVDLIAYSTNLTDSPLDIELAKIVKRFELEVQESQ